MKEFIEKLIGRLEEQKKRYREIRKNTYCRRTEMDDCESCRADHYLDARLEGINKAKEIVNQLAEEYINCSTDSSTNKESVKGDLISRSALVEKLRKKFSTKDVYWTAIANVIIDIVEEQPTVKGSD